MDGKMILHIKREHWLKVFENRRKK